MEYTAAEQKLIDTVINYKNLEFSGEDPLDMIVEALEDGANLFVTMDGVDILTYAVNKENIDLVEFLLEVSYKGKKFDLDKLVTSKDTLLTKVLRSPFVHPDLAEMLIKAGADVNKLDKEDVSPLILAVQHEKTSDIQLLIEHGADINYLTPNTKVSPFLVACQGTSVPTVKMMLDKGVDINITNPIGLNGLMLGLSAFGMYATKEDKKNRKKIINLLLDSGIDVSHVAKSGLTSLWSSVGSWAEMDKIAQSGADLYAIHNFPQENKKPFAHMLLDMQVVKVKQKMKNKGDTDADVAEAAELEEDFGDFFADKTRKEIFKNFKAGIADSEGNTLEAIVVTNPLLVRNYRDDIIPLIKDVNINQLYKTSVTQTHQQKASLPFLSGVFGNFKEEDVLRLLNDWKSQGQKVELLVDNPDIPILSQPLMILLIKGKLQTLAKIVKEDNIDLDSMEISGKVKGKKYHIVELFQNVIKNSGLSNIQTELTNTTNILKGIEINRAAGVVSNVFKDEAAIEKQLKKAKLELEKKLDTFLKYQEQAADILRYLGVNFNKLNSKGAPVLFAAEDKETIELFEKMGANIREKAQNGDSILVNALLTGSFPVLEYVNNRWLEESNPLLENAIIQTLYHGDLNERLQQSVLEPTLHAFINMYAKKVDELDPKSELVYNCPFINKKDEDGNSALLIAAANDYLYVMKPLIKAGANINEKNENGETAIMHAIANENYAMVKFLFENKVDINVENNDGVTIDDLLEDVSNKELIKMVEDYQVGEFNPDNAKVKFKPR